YALVLVVGRFVDDMGRRPALIGGLLVEAVSAAGIGWAHSVAASCVCLFGLGIGWNVAFVAAAAELTDIALPAERGKLLGFTDLVSGLTGAGFALAGGVIYSQMGAIALGVGAMAIAAVPAAWFTVTAVRRPPVSFSPPNAPPISAPLGPMLTLAMPQSEPAADRNRSLSRRSLVKMHDDR